MLSTQYQHVGVIDSVFESAAGIDVVLTGGKMDPGRSGSGVHHARPAGERRIQVSKDRGLAAFFVDDRDARRDGSTISVSDIDNQIRFAERLRLRAGIDCHIADENVLLLFRAEDTKAIGAVF